MFSRDRLIAIAVCSVIFVTVLIIGTITASRSDARKPTPIPATAEKQSTAVPEQNANTSHEETPEPLPKKKHRFKSPRSMTGTAFDHSQVRQLPKRLAKYNFTAGILVDLDSRQVIWKNNSSRPIPIASLSKLMTIYTAFEEIEQRPGLELTALVTVSQECTQTAKVKLNLTPGEKVQLHELFIYSMLYSANDAAHLIAEYFGYGSSSNFIKLMNSKASEIGMTTHRFYNANGLPIYSTSGQAQDTKMNTVSCEDMVKLIDHIYEYPMILRYTSCREKNTRHGNFKNGNMLLTTVKGMEGLKTGYTNAAGNCLAFSCKRNGRRLAGLVTGFSKRKNCFEFTKELIEWGFLQ